MSMRGYRRNVGIITSRNFVCSFILRSQVNNDAGSIGHAIYTFCRLWRYWDVFLARSKRTVGFTFSCNATWQAAEALPPGYSPTTTSLSVDGPFPPVKFRTSNMPCLISLVKPCGTHDTQVRPSFSFNSHHLFRVLSVRNCSSGK